MIKGNLGANELLFITEPIDKWINASIGSSARVFRGVWKQDENTSKIVAVKIMRPDNLSYALPLFQEEIKVLSLMSDVQGVIKMLAMGILESQQPIRLPSDNVKDSARDVSGNITIFYPNESNELLRELEQRIIDEKDHILKPDWVSRWCPYLILQIRPHKENLLYLCDPAYSGGKLLPLKDGLRIASQICNILEISHRRNIVYRDHKIIHYYYSDVLSQVFIVDWNVAKFFPQGLSQSEIQSDLIQFSARTLNYILTGRSADAALGLGPTKPIDIAKQPRSYIARWTYDDERLPESVKSLLINALNGEFTSATSLKNSILKILSQETVS